MCAILELESGYTPPYWAISNVCANNPHGYGIVIKRKGKLEVIRECPEGGNDPEVIYRILKDNEDAYRVLHVRWKTKGDISLENTQPFTVYDDGKRKVVFMHNGTLTGYGSTTYNYGVHQQNKGPEDSDSKEFADKVLIEYLPVMKGEKGVADITNPKIQALIDKYWSTGSRGILICNNLDSYYLNKNGWELINTTETIDGKEVRGSFFASNNDYFEKVKRGPLFEKMEVERKKREAEEAKSSTGSTTSKVATPPTSPGFFRRHGITEEASDLLDDFDMYDAEGYIALANMTYAEMITLVKKSPDGDVASLFMYLTDFLAQNTKKLLKCAEENEELKLKLALNKVDQKDAA